MSLHGIREERKKLGFGRTRGPRTSTLILLLVFVLLFIAFLGRVG